MVRNITPSGREPEPELRDQKGEQHRPREGAHIERFLSRNVCLGRLLLDDWHDQLANRSRSRRDSWNL